jgi:diadenosine tetraphosphate (Ap4A) HIT family hydrolase
MGNKIMNQNCLICQRITMIKQGTNPYFVQELKTGYVVLGDHQFYHGYTLFLSKQHVSELHELGDDFRQEFLKEMSLVARAVWETFKPKKLNYELLGNTDQHAHWHIFPRYADDPEPLQSTWVLDKKIRKADSAKPSAEELVKLKEKLKSKLEELLQKQEGI